VLELDAAPSEQMVLAIECRPTTLALPAPPSPGSCLPVRLDLEAGLSPQLANRAVESLPSPHPQSSLLAIRSEFGVATFPPNLTIGAAAAPALLDGPSPASNDLALLPTAAMFHSGVAREPLSHQIVLSPGELSTPPASNHDDDEEQPNPSGPSLRQLALQEATASVGPPTTKARSSEETSSRHPGQLEASIADREGSGCANHREALRETDDGEVAQPGQDETGELEGTEGSSSDRQHNESLRSETSQAVSSPNGSNPAAGLADSPTLHPATAMSQSSSCESLAILAEGWVGVGARAGSEAGSERRSSGDSSLPVLDLPREELVGAAALESATALGGSTSKRKLLLALVGL
jgi:hypothetical protein